MVSILINCRNRQESLARLLASIRTHCDGEFEIVILDDASEPPLVAAHGERLLRSEKQLGVGAGRNFLAREARGDFLLILDDDTEITDKDLLQHLIVLSERLGHRAVLAARQLDARGISVGYQPADCSEPCFCRRFLGYAVFSPKDLWLTVGGFYEPFGYQFEEAEVCWRILDAGYAVVFDPQFAVIHHFIAGAPEQMQAKHVNLFSNMLIAVLLRAPWVLMPIFLLSAVGRYWKYSQARPSAKWAGAGAAFRRFFAHLPMTLKDRKAVRVKTWLAYHKLNKTPRLQPS